MKQQMFRMFTNRRAGCFRLQIIAMLCCIASSAASAQSEGKFYFWVVGFANESFAIEVNASQKAQIESFWANRQMVRFNGRIAPGSVAYNRNYNAAGQPLWNWHVAFVDDIVEWTHDPFGDQMVYPPRDGKPSDIAADPQRWVEEYGGAIRFKAYYIQSEIDPSRKDAVANVSNRGMTGAGEKALITGVIITGGEPRNVVVRALGPSMSAAGVQQVAGNPKIEVFTAAGRSLASNNDWKTNARAGALAEAYPALAPKNDKEAALLLTLMAGSYTLHGTNEDGTEGVVLLEAYDVDSNNE